MTFVVLLIIALVVAGHWAISRTKFYPVGLAVPLAWVVGIIVCMIRDHSLIDARGIAAGLGGTAFLFATWASGVEHYKNAGSQGSRMR